MHSIFSHSALVFFIWLLLSPVNLHAQKENPDFRDIAQGEFLLQLSPDINGKSWAEENRNRFEGMVVEYSKTVSKNLNAVLIEVENAENKNPYELADEMSRNPGVLHAFPNRLAQYRTNQPDDPRFWDQWHLAQIQIQEAWEITTGGTTQFGDTIVIAVIDSGCQLDHPDLQANLWYNRAEIPGSGMDEDGNGYIDDYYGLNIATGNDQHSNSPHGTEVTGVAAAVTNNGIGISGPAWETEVMIVSKTMGRWSEAEAIEAYEYILYQRQLYNETEGQLGAFVVATNFSAGWNEARADDFPLLCEMYNILGEAGILSTTAVVNSAVDVDVFGDIPTLCPSPYKISVTNSNMDDRKFSNAGYSAASVDLAAPGTQIMTTDINSGYIVVSGTSVAAPQVSAAIGLLYSVKCEEFAHLIHSHPRQAALAVKKAIKSGVDVNPELEQFTRSGGRLNVFQSLLNLDQCDTDLGPLSLTRLYPNPTLGELQIEFLTPGFDTYKIEITDVLGRRVLTMPLETIAFSPSIRKVDVSHLPAGMYLLHITEASRSETMTFIKK